MLVGVIMDYIEFDIMTAPILFCRVGWMNYYCGTADDPIVNGGSYNLTHDGHESFNYKSHNGKYYGYVESGYVKDKENPELLHRHLIHIEKLGAKESDDYIDGLLIVWVGKPANAKGQYIVGWYKNAKLHRELQIVPDSVKIERNTEELIDYNVLSDDVYLLPTKDRNYLIPSGKGGMGQNQFWYGNEKIISEVREYISNIENNQNNVISSIEDISIIQEGKERTALIKTRVNQSSFRDRLFALHKKCCITNCGVSAKELLIASHIIPWSQSDKYQKLNVNNGLMLCPNHDKLFDAGLISFDSAGKIMISQNLSETDRLFMNVTSDMRINVSDECLEFMKYQRENIFR